jgi:hypothetical protein
MQQYSPKNQALILTQCPHATDVRKMSDWNKAGMKVVKGEKAIRLWMPKRGKARPTEAGLATGQAETERQYFILVAKFFDISQVEPAPANTGKQARRVAATIRQAAQDAEYDIYCDNIAGMDNPPSFTEWQQVQREAALAWEEADNVHDAPMPEPRFTFETWGGLSKWTQGTAD